MRISRQSFAILTVTVLILSCTAPVSADNSTVVEHSPEANVAAPNATAAAPSPSPAEVVAASPVPETTQEHANEHEQADVGEGTPDEANHAPANSTVEGEEFVDEPYGPINDDEFGNVAIAAFQPSHFLTFRLQRNTEESFFVEATAETMHQRVQGNFFITNGGDMLADFTILDPNGAVVVDRTEVSEAYYDFTLEVEGTYRMVFRNPQSDDMRRITFACLVGEDMDKPALPPKDKANEASTTLFHSVGRIHRKLDKVISMMAFTDVRLSRNSEIQRNTDSRVALFSVIESCVLAGVTLLQVWYIRRIVDNSTSKLPGAPISGSGRRYR